MGLETIAIITGVSMLWPGLMFLLPPKVARWFKPIGKVLKAIANTPGGLKIK